MHASHLSFKAFFQVIKAKTGIIKGHSIIELHIKQWKNWKASTLVRIKHWITCTLTKRFLAINIQHLISCLIIHELKWFRCCCPSCTELQISNNYDTASAIKKNNKSSELGIHKWNTNKTTLTKQNMAKINGGWHHSWLHRRLMQLMVRII